MDATGCRVSGLRRTSKGPSQHSCAAPDQRGSTNVDVCRQTSPTNRNINVQSINCKLKLNVKNLHLCMNMNISAYFRYIHDAQSKPVP